LRKDEKVVVENKQRKKGSTVEPKDGKGEIRLSLLLKRMRRCHALNVRRKGEKEPGKGQAIKNLKD